MSWLSSADLKRLVRRHGSKETKTAFMGIFPIDSLPKRILHFPCLLIVNTDTKNLPGKHWKAVYISKQRRGEVFDSFALPTSMRLTKWLNTFTRGRWTKTTRPIQSYLSAICGIYVLYFVLNRLSSKDMKSLMKVFDNSVTSNDKRMLQFFSTLKK